MLPMREVLFFLQTLSAFGCTKEENNFYKETPLGDSKYVMSLILLWKVCYISYNSLELLPPFPSSNYRIYPMLLIQVSISS